MYDTKENAARYICLFQDWHADWGHLKFHDTQLDDVLREFLAKVREMGNKGNNVASELSRAFLGLSPLQSLSLIGKQLKTIFFYKPATTTLLTRSKNNESCWSWMRLDYEYLEEVMKFRSDAERAAGKEGHWKYGVELEKIYLSTGTFNVFGEYFIEDKKNGNMLCITALCTTQPNADRLTGLDKVIANHGRHFRKLGAQAAKAASPSRTRKIADSIIAWLPGPLEDKERRVRDKIVQDISELGDEELILLAKLVEPVAPEHLVPFPKFQEALDHVRNDRSKK
jgi:hypothetical protein